VVASGLPRAGTSELVPLNIEEFLSFIERMAWAKENGCPWVARTCAAVAPQGHNKVLRRVLELDCLWDSSTCAAAAEGGHLEGLVWARTHRCAWYKNLVYLLDEDYDCYSLAASGGHLGC
jgi:hypothetical protein